MTELFQGMSEKNILTFNPGLDSNAWRLATCTDVRKLQRELRAQGVQLQQQADESPSEPASFVAVDRMGIRPWPISTFEHETGWN